MCRGFDFEYTCCCCFCCFLVDPNDVTTEFSMVFGRIFSRLPGSRFFYFYVHRSEISNLNRHVTTVVRTTELLCSNFVTVHQRGLGGAYSRFAHDVYLRGVHGNIFSNAFTYEYGTGPMTKDDRFFVSPVSETSDRH